MPQVREQANEIVNDVIKPLVSAHGAEGMCWRVGDGCCKGDLVATETVQAAMQASMRRTNPGVLPAMTVGHEKQGWSRCCSGGVYAASRVDVSRNTRRRARRCDEEVGVESTLSESMPCSHWGRSPTRCGMRLCCRARMQQGARWRGARVRSVACECVRARASPSFFSGPPSPYAQGRGWRSEEHDAGGDGSGSGRTCVAVEEEGHSGRHACASKSSGGT